MSTAVNIIVWWTGAVVVLAAFFVASVVVAYGLRELANSSLRLTLMLMRLSTARYWVKRMEREGLTVCRKEYQRMVAERKATTIADFQQAEQDDEHGITGEQK